MGYGVTVFFYLIVGTTVAVAIWLGEDARNESRLFRTLTSPLFWPLYIPLLLARHSFSVAGTSCPLSKDNSGNTDAIGSLIVKVESELDTAFRSLDGWAENVLAGEQGRIVELRTAWRQQADHIRELDQLLIQASAETSNINGGSEEPQERIGPSPVEEQSIEPDDGRSTRFASCEKARHENVLRLKRVRRQMYDELMATLAWVRELVTMIHLAKFTGAPASRAVELVQQIAAAVKGLSNGTTAGHTSNCAKGGSQLTM